MSQGVISTHGGLLYEHKASSLSAVSSRVILGPSYPSIASSLALFAHTPPACRAGRRTGRGDCSDHAVLVCARRLMVRSRTWPARPSHFPLRHPAECQWWRCAVLGWLAGWLGARQELLLPHADCPQRWRLRQRRPWPRWQARCEGLFAVVRGSRRVWRW